MRASRIIRARRAVQIAIGSLLLAAPVATAAEIGGTGVKAQTPGPHAAAAIERHSSRFVVRRRPRYALVGQMVSLPGRLRSAGGHAEIMLQWRRGHRWITIERLRTGPRGGFALHYRVRAGATVALRAHFNGSKTARPTSAMFGNVVSLEPAVASWYYDNTGGTACGFHAGYGVASKTLPCGTRVTLAYGGRRVVATVDDRGPYVAGRSFDLGLTTAAALGMQGVQTIDAS